MRTLSGALQRQTGSRRAYPAQLFRLVAQDGGDDARRRRSTVRNPTGPEQLIVEVGTSGSAGLRKMLLPLEIFIPLDRVTVLPHRGGWSTALELRIAVEDKRGDRNDILVTPVTLPAFPDRPPPGAVIVYETSLKMRRLRHKLVVSIHDKGASEVLWTKLEVGPRGATSGK